MRTLQFILTQVILPIVIGTTAALINSKCEIEDFPVLIIKIILIIGVIIIVGRISADYIFWLSAVKKDKREVFINTGRSAEITERIFARQHQKVNVAREKRPWLAAKLAMTFGDWGIIQYLSDRYKDITDSQTDFWRKKRRQLHPGQWR